MKVKKPLELEHGDEIEVGASLEGVYTFTVTTVTGSPIYFDGQARVEVEEMEWLLLIPEGDDVTVVNR